jgi:hypothetical protein
VTFDVIFKPKNLDPDICQENIALNIPGHPPLFLSCTGGFNVISLLLSNTVNKVGTEIIL